MTLYHTILELLKPYTPARVKAVSVALESHAQTFYPEDYSPDEVLPDINADVSVSAELDAVFEASIATDGLEKSCIEARRALGELLEKIGGQL